MLTGLISSIVVSAVLVLGASGVTPAQQAPEVPLGCTSSCAAPSDSSQCSQCCTDQTTCLSCCTGNFTGNKKTLCDSYCHAEWPIL